MSYKGSDPSRLTENNIRRTDSMKRDPSIKSVGSSVYTTATHSLKEISNDEYASSSKHSMQDQSPSKKKDSSPLQNLMDSSFEDISSHSSQGSTSPHRGTHAYSGLLNTTEFKDHSNVFNVSNSSNSQPASPKEISSDNFTRRNLTATSFNDHPGNRSSMLSNYSGVVHNVDIDTVRYVVDQEGNAVEDGAPSEVISQVRTIRSGSKLSHSAGAKDLSTYLTGATPVIHEDDRESIREPLILETKTSTSGSSPSSMNFLSVDRSPRLPDKEEFTDMGYTIPARSPRRPNSGLVSHQLIDSAIEEEKKRNESGAAQSKSNTGFTSFYDSTKQTSPITKRTSVQGERVSDKFDDIMKEFEDLKSEIEAELQSDSESEYNAAATTESHKSFIERNASVLTVMASSTSLPKDSITSEEPKQEIRNIPSSTLLGSQSLPADDRKLSPGTSSTSNQSHDHTYSITTSIRTGQESFHTAKEGGQESDYYYADDGDSSKSHNDLSRQGSASTISKDSIFEREVKNLTAGVEVEDDGYEDIEDEMEEHNVRESTTKGKKHSNRTRHKSKSKIKPFSYDTLARLLNATDGIVIGQEFANLEIPTQEKYLIEQIVDSISRLTTNMVLNPNRYDQGCERLEKVLNALEGFE